jgi:hypothetical protein
VVGLDERQAEVDPGGDACGCLVAVAVTRLLTVHVIAPSQEQLRGKR